MLISNQGTKPGSINMGRILRNLRHHSDMSRKVVYHRLPIFNKDDYGVETGEIDTNELLLPQLPALIRPALTADYIMERAGANVIGAARVYTPNLQTIKGFDNFDQTTTNPNFNEIEGWDRFIDRTRTIMNVPTSADGTASGAAASLLLSGGFVAGTGTTDLGTWANSANASTDNLAGGTYETDGEMLTVTLGTTPSGAFNFTPAAGITNQSTLESDRIQFQIKASGTVLLRAFSTFQGSATSGTAGNQLTYTNANITIPTDSWMTVDVPFVSGTVASGTSIYLDGTRYAVTLDSGSAFTYVQDCDKFEFDVSGSEDDLVYIKNIDYYKSISWHVHSVKEINNQFIIFNCVRTRGQRDSRRRAYDT